MFSKHDLDVVIDDLHAQDCGSPERIGVYFTATKGSKDASGVEFNALTKDACMNISMRLKRDDETDIACNKNAIQIKGENDS